MQGSQGSQQFPDGLLLEVSTLDMETMYLGPQVEEILFWQVGGSLQDSAQFGQLKMKCSDSLVFGKELHSIHSLMP